MPNKLYATVNSGIYKGKKIQLPSLCTTRSTKNIVKGSFFNTVRDDIRGKIFIECFAGSGIMACEALSNGAKMSIAIEKDKNAYDILKKNISLIGGDIKSYNKDCFEILPQILTNLQDKTILYMDPPFEIRSGYEDIYKKTMSLIRKVSEFEVVYMICIEHMSKVEFKEKILNFTLLKSRKFGSTALSYFIK